MSSPASCGRGLHHLVAVGADGGRHDQPQVLVVGVRPAPVRSISRRNARPAAPASAAKQLLGLIQRQHQRRRPAPSVPGFGQPVGGGLRASRPAARAPGRHRWGRRSSMSPSGGSVQTQRRRPSWMARARPVSPVSALRSGRMMSSSTKRRSSRRSRGSSPARRNDDLPRARRAKHHEQRLRPRRCACRAARPAPARLRRRGRRTPRRRCSSNGSQPRYGARSRIAGRGPHEVLGADARARGSPRAADAARRWRTAPAAAVGDLDLGLGSRRRTDRSAATPR